MNEVPVSYLHEALAYDLDTGILTWRARPRSHFKTGRYWKDWNLRYAGCAAGSPLFSGYFNIRLTFGGKQYSLLCHRVAWAISTDKWPKHQIDHKNLVRTDNRLINLREGTNRENSQNRNLQSNNTSGLMGVSWDRAKQKWRADIAVSGRSYHLGRFRTPELAHKAYLEAKKQLHLFNPVPRDLAA